jgi:hypothetical protein
VSIEDTWNVEFVAASAKDAVAVIGASASTMKIPNAVACAYQEALNLLPRPLGFGGPFNYEVYVKLSGKTSEGAPPQYPASEINMSIKLILKPLAPIER